MQGSRYIHGQYGGSKGGVRGGHGTATGSKHGARGRGARARARAGTPLRPAHRGVLVDGLAGGLREQLQLDDERREVVVHAGALGMARRRRQRFARAHLRVDPRLDVKVLLAKGLEGILHPCGCPSCTPGRDAPPCARARARWAAAAGVLLVPPSPSGSTSALTNSSREQRPLRSRERAERTPATRAGGTYPRAAGSETAAAMSKKRVAIVGSGNWGCAIAKIVANNAARHNHLHEEVGTPARRVPPRSRAAAACPAAVPSVPRDARVPLARGRAR